MCHGFTCKVSMNMQVRYGHLVVVNRDPAWNVLGLQVITVIGLQTYYLYGRTRVERILSLRRHLEWRQAGTLHRLPSDLHRHPGR